MKKLLSVTFFLTLVLISFDTYAADIPALMRDGNGTPLQSFVPDPAKSQTNTAMTGTISFKKGTGGTVNCTGWLAIKVNPTADATYYFNSDTGKTYPIISGEDNIIWLGQLATGESVNLVLGSATASIQGK